MVRDGFQDVVNNSFASWGFAAEAPKVVFPSETFLRDSDLTPISEGIDKVIAALTKWEPETKELGIKAPPKVTVTGKDYQEALDNMNELFLKNLWGDGHNLFPPTEEQVEWMLRGTDLPRDTLIARFPPTGGLATPESIAVIAAMAGCRPEYMPVLIAVVETLCDPEFSLAGTAATTGPHIPTILINGPIRKQLDINGSSGLLGPGWKANAAIGRTIPLMMMCLGGVFPGITNMKTQAHSGAYGCCFGENEEAIPEDSGWNPYHVDRGFARDANVVTMFTASSQIRSGYGGLLRMAETMKVSTLVNTPSEMLCIFSPEDFTGYVLQPFECDLDFDGYSYKVSWPAAPNKKAAQQWLWEHSHIPFEQHMNSHPEHIKRGRFDPGGSSYDFAVEYAGKMVPQCKTPDDVHIIVGGGEGLHSVLIPGGRFMPREIKLPPNWDELLEEAKAHVREPFS
jgi:hypothetical protein